MRTYPVVRFAAERAGVSTVTAYKHRNEDPNFAEDWDVARKDGLMRLELLAFEKAEQDDTMLRWILSRNWRDRYGDQVKHEITGAEGSPFEVVLSWGNGIDKHGEEPDPGEDSANPGPSPESA
jgi:hypothetical protein